MKNVFTIVRNNFRRAAGRRTYILISLGITFMTILLAVYFTSNFEIKGNIALVSRGSVPEILSKSMNVRLMESVPPMSQLVMNKFDAVVIDRGNGEYVVDTIKNREFEETVLKLLKNPGACNGEDHKSRKAGTVILGYMIMFLLLQGLYFMAFFTEDKERRSFRRIVTSPASIAGYLAANCIFSFIMVYVPTMAVLAVCREALGIDIGFAYLQYAGLLAMFVAFSSTFALFMTAVLENPDNVMALASSIAVLTSILSGSFSAVNTGSSAVNRFIGLIPQKAYLTLVQGLENGKTFTDYLPQAGYMLVLSLAMAGLGVMVCRRRFNAGRY